METFITIYLCSVVVAFFMAVYMSFADWSRGVDVTTTTLFMIVVGSIVSPFVIFAFISEYRKGFVIIKGKK